MNNLRVALFLTLSWTLAGCGYKGDLYLPEEAAGTAVETAAQADSAPQPGPAEAEQEPDADGSADLASPASPANLTPLP